MLEVSNNRVQINYKEYPLLDKTVVIALSFVFAAAVGLYLSTILFHIFNVNNLYCTISGFVLFCVFYVLFFTLFKNNYKKGIEKEIDIDEMTKIIDILEPLNLPNKIKSKMKAPLTYSKMKELIPEINLYLENYNENAKKEKVENFFR